MPAADERHDLVEGRAAGQAIERQRVAAAVVGAEVQAHAQAQDLHAAGRLLARHHLPQVMVQVVHVVGQVGGRLHRAAVRDDDEDAPLQRVVGGRLAQAGAGPLDGFAIHALAEEIVLQQRRQAGAGAAPGGRQILEDDIQTYPMVNQPLCV